VNLQHVHDGAHYFSKARVIGYRYSPEETDSDPEPQPHRFTVSIRMDIRVQEEEC